MSDIQPIILPDIGDFDEVEVIEILVNVGDDIAKEDSIITLESDKASMEIPSPVAGKVVSLKVALGDKLKLGDLILELSVAQNSTAETETPAKISDTEISDTEAPSKTSALETVAKTQLTQTIEPDNAEPIDTDNNTEQDSHASPSIRKLARELGANLAQIIGTGLKGRILEMDLKNHVKHALSQQNTNNTGVLPSVPTIDFAKFGAVEIQPLTRINKLSAKHLTACWLNIPHVTQFDEAHIDQMEAFRQSQKAKGNKLTPLVFVMRAVAQTLKMHPKFNASLDQTGEHLIIKKYINLGIAIDTPKGLVVAVIRDVAQKSFTELANELTETSHKARNGKLTPRDMQGGCFTISSLGGIGGTQFTPIVNAPEVAILGVSRAQIKPVWNGKDFSPTLTLPLALSYDHRVIDGAQGARFMRDLSRILGDIQEILL